MGGGRSSSSNATSSTSNTIDAKQTADGNAIVAHADGGNVTINRTADGAFDFGSDALFANTETTELALKFGERVVDRLVQNNKSSLDLVDRATRESLDTVSDGFKQLVQDGREDTTELLSTALMIGIPAIAAIMIFRSN